MCLELALALGQVVLGRQTRSKSGRMGLFQRNRSELQGATESGPTDMVALASSQQRNLHKIDLALAKRVLVLAKPVLVLAKPALVLVSAKVLVLGLESEHNICLNIAPDHCIASLGQQAQFPGDNVARLECNSPGRCYMVALLALVLELAIRVLVLELAMPVLVLESAMVLAPLHNRTLHSALH